MFSNLRTFFAYVRSVKLEKYVASLEKKGNQVRGADMGKLILQDLNKIYPNGVHAVRDFNLVIEDGEFIVFVGPSGCGKTTTLRMIAGLENITSGVLTLEKEYRKRWNYQN